ncbi:MAG: lectin-like protein, partial [Bacteroidota bacterium]
ITNAQLKHAGKYYLTTTANGCTHLDSITVVINCVPVVKPTVSASICAGSTYTFYGQTLTVAGTYKDTLHTAGACDTVRVLSLSIANPFAAATLPVSEAGNFGQKYTYNGHNYYLSTGTKTWSEAEAYAESLGGHLATITDANENVAVGSLVPFSYTDYVFIGASDAAIEGVWTWVTGEPFTYSDWSGISNEPNGGTEENYLSYFANVADRQYGQWNDFPGDLSRQFIIEFDQTSFTVSSNSPLPSGDTLQLTASSLTGASYAWRGPSGFTSTQQNPTITNTTLNNAGTYYLTTTANGCTRLDSVTVVINCVPFTKPAVSASICAGSTYTFYGRTLTIAGIYTDTLHTAGACDSVRVLSLTVTNPFGGVSLPASEAGNFGSAQIYNGHTYYISNISKPTWYEAKAYCESLGGHLAVAAQNDENSAITLMLSDFGYWLGGTDHETEGTWKWITGEPYTSSHWASSQPDDYPYNNNEGGQDYMVLYKDSQWDDQESTSQNRFILEYDQTAYVASSNSPLPVGQTLNFTATSLTGATYAWRGPNSFSSTQQNPSITNAQLRHAGKYYLTTTSDGCTHLDSVTVVINCVPVVKPTVSASICAGSSYTFYGRTLTTSGTYTDTLHTAGACDSVRVLSLMVNDPFGSQPASLSNGLVAYYPFSGNANDMSGGGFNAGGSGYTFANDRFGNAGNAVSLNGTASNLFVTNFPDLSSGSFTVSGWFKYEPVDNPNVDYPTIFCLQNPVSLRKVYSHLGGSNYSFPEWGTLAALTELSNGSRYDFASKNYTTKRFDDRKWHFFAVVYNRDNLTQLSMLDSIVYEQGSMSSFVAGPLTLFNFNFQKHNLQNYTYPFGLQDDYRIYNRALSVNELNALYASTSSFTAASNSPISVGDTLKLTATTLTGATYAWRGPNSFASNQQNPSI